MLIQSIKTSAGTIMLIEQFSSYRIVHFNNQGARMYSFDLPFNQYDVTAAVDELIEHVCQ
jgi:hypothetical protein